MESSLASIGTFSGQALQGVNQLHAFFKDVSLARQRTADLLDELQFLAFTLTDIQRLVARLEQASNDSGNLHTALYKTVSNISTLKSRLKTCAMEVTAWVQVTTDSDPSSENGVWAFFKKVKVAVNKSGFEEMGRKISGHRQRLGLSLSVLGRWMDQVGFTRVAELSAKFDGLTDAHLKLNDSINKQIAVSAEDRPHEAAISEAIGSQLRPLETSIEDHFDRMSSNHSESQQSIHSLSHSISSLASQMSQLLEMANVSDVSQKHSVKAPGITNAKIAETEDEWCCDSISGIDGGFIETGNAKYSCIYCFSVFQWGPENSHERGRHLAEAHSFGKCNLMITYQSWDELMLHLDTFHAAKRIHWADDLFCRKRKPLPLLRDQHFSDEHPSEAVERSSEGKIIRACLNMALAECGLPEPSDYLAYSLEPCEIYGSYWYRTAGNTQNDARYKIGCLLEELFVSGNDGYFDNTHALESLIISKIKNEVCKDAPHQDGFTQRKRINAWFLQSLTKSLPLRLLLASGKVTADLTPATSPNWLIPILAVWNIDEAATGAEQLCELSDGAVDSRDDLKPDPDFDVQLASDDQNNAEEVTSARNHLLLTQKLIDWSPTLSAIPDFPSLRSGTIGEDDRIFHPLVSKYLIKMADSDFLEERLDRFLHSKKALERKRQRRERFNQSLEPEEKAWLERSDAEQNEISMMLQEAKGKLEELREQCLAAGLVDEIGRAIDYSSKRER